jgi:hypothetical protein
MSARLLGWPGQVGIFFERKRFFERTLFEQKFSYIYKAFFSLEFLSKFMFFSKERLFERTYKNSAFRTNGIRKKKMNFERTLFEQTTSSRNLDTNLLGSQFFTGVYIVLIYALQFFALKVKREDFFCLNVTNP